ncbi:MAG TPA: acetyl-CoA carboxylase carboxyltransferase subunit beta, partial [Bacteroidetes bacterium]|nr:acetyl-CoA carboxylase carboxyltransferase subunit beta [Bacteroidota bacterium]
WFRRKQQGVLTTEKKVLPDGLWIKCEQCGEVLYRQELERNMWVCHKCDFHFRIQSHHYILFLLDDGSFEEFYAGIKSVDPLRFKGKKKYADQLKDAVKKTGMNEAIRTGFGKINGKPVVMAIMDFSFIGGSMGSVVGEKVALATEKAMERNLPLIIISSSGGARMMEAAFSLMQMAKTAAALARFSDRGGLYISVLTNPTTGGTTASYAMLGDVNVAEPGALIGFAGPRVIKETIGQDLPDGFQRSEFVLEHGFLDIIVKRQAMKKTLSQLIDSLKGGQTAQAS